MSSHLNASARWIITGDLALESAALFGPSEERRLVRDAESGGVTIPGEALSGLLRDYLVERLAGYGASAGTAENAGGTSPADWLFGSEPQRALLVADAGARMPDGSTTIPTESRIFSTIEHRRGISRSRSRPAHGIAAGPVFQLRFDLVVAGASPAPSNPEVTWPAAAIDPAIEASVLAALVAALEGLCSGGIQIGSRRSRGFGVVSAGGWRARRFDLGSEPGREAWAAACAADQPIDPAVSPASLDIRRLIEEVAVGGGVSLPLVEESPRLAVLPDRRRRITADIKLRVDSSLLVKTGGKLPTHVSSGGQPMLPGSVVAGALRSHAARLLGLVESDRRVVAGEIDSVFGTAAQDAGDSDAATQGTASRLRVTEAPIEHASPMRVSRLPISRFTGSGKTEASTEQPELGGRARLTLELRDPSLEEAGLFMLLLKDLMDGQVSLGSGSAVGRGLLTGNGVAVFPDDMLTTSDGRSGGEKKLPEGFDVAPESAWCKLFPGQSPYGPADKLVDQAIRAFAARAKGEAGELEAVMS